MTEPFVARGSPGRVAMLALGAAAFVALSYWVTTIYAAADRPIRHYTGWAGVVVFGCFFLLMLPRLFATGPELRVDQTGIWWRRWSNETIPWREITAMEARSIRRSQFLCLVLRDPATCRPTTLTGRLQGANRAMGFGDIAIATTGTDQRFAALIEAVRRFAPPDAQPSGLP